MGRGPWVKEKTQEGKHLCILALGLKLEYEGISFDNLAKEYKTISGISEEDFLKSRLKPQKEITPDVVQNKPAAADQPEKTEKKSRSINGYSKTGAKLGRPNKEISTKKYITELKRQKNADNFLLVENSPPDVINNNDIYINNLIETVEIIKSEFFADNPDLIKKHPSVWFRNLCNQIKKNIPKIDFNNIQLLSAIWDIYADLCLSVGINRTIQNFEIFTGFSYSLIKKLQKESSPERIELLKKIHDQSEGDIIGGLSSSFGSSPNQMFIAKAVYGLTENTVVTHVSAASETKKVDDIPLFLPEK